MNKISALLLLPWFGLALVQPPAHPTLVRRYSVGETLVYRMHGINDQWRYEIEAAGVVKKDEAGAFVEEYQWRDFQSDGKLVELPPASTAFRQPLSLDPARNPSIPDLSKVDPRMIGPITDMLTFYSDLWLAEKTGQLIKPGDHFYFRRDTPNSWADGTYVIAGADEIDFEMTLKSINEADKTATVVVRHVVPAKPRLKFAAPWMEKPVADTPNNWEQVMRAPGGDQAPKWVASVGQETFDVEMKVSLLDGIIISGSLDNTVRISERICEDRELAKCGEATPHTTHRKIDIAIVGPVPAPVSDAKPGN